LGWQEEKKFTNLSNQQTNKYTSQDPKSQLTWKITVKNNGFNSKTFFSWENLVGTA